MTDEPEPDTCRHVDIDGETIRVRGAGEMSDESRAALTEVIRAARQRMISEQRAALAKYPYQDGETTVLGPEIFASSDGSVICWKGENYIRQPEPAPAGLREQYRAALARFIDPDDDCMPTLSEDGKGFTWVPANSILDQLLAVRDRRMEQLTAGRATWKAKAEEIEADRDRLAAAIERVRHLHRPVGVVAAAEFGEPPQCAACRRSWPCPTSTALEPPKVSTPPEDPPVQCWHTEPGSPCDWNICRQPERLAAGDRGTDPAHAAPSPVDLPDDS